VLRESSSALQWGLFFLIDEAACSSFAGLAVHLCRDAIDGRAPLVPGPFLKKQIRKQAPGFSALTNFSSSSADDACCGRPAIEERSRRLAGFLPGLGEDFPRKPVIGLAPSAPECPSERRY
jgi:hypothetical protein